VRSSTSARPASTRGGSQPRCWAPSPAPGEGGSGSGGGGCTSSAGIGGEGGDALPLASTSVPGGIASAGGSAPLPASSGAAAAVAAAPAGRGVSRERGSSDSKIAEFASQGYSRPQSAQFGHPLEGVGSSSSSTANSSGPQPPRLPQPGGASKGFLTDRSGIVAGKGVALGRRGLAAAANERAASSTPQPEVPSPLPPWKTQPASATTATPSTRSGSAAAATSSSGSTRLSAAGSGGGQSEVMPAAGAAHKAEGAPGATGVHEQIAEDASGDVTVAASEPTTARKRRSRSQDLSAGGQAGAAGAASGRLRAPLVSSETAPLEKSRPTMAEIAERSGRRNDTGSQAKDRTSTYSQSTTVVADADGDGMVPTVAAAAHSRGHGPVGLDCEAEGQLLGAQDLPMVGAAGVLVMPHRPQSTSLTAPGSGVVDPMDIALGFVGGGAGFDLSGWGEDAEQDLSASQLYDNARQEKRFSRYLAAEVLEASPATGPSRSPPPSAREPAWELVKAMAAEVQPPKPKEGPTLLQIAKDPRRREECPICAAEWNQALRQFSMRDLHDAGEAETPMPIARRCTSNRKAKMHSLRCNWMWFQQSLSTSLCALRFDEKGDPRPRPSSPSSVLPPPMYDVWHFWRQRSGRSNGDRDRDRAAATDRLVRGEPAG